MISRFVPHPLVPGGQLQTLVAFAWHEASAFQADEQIHVPLDDGDELVLDLNHPQFPLDPCPLVYLIHGLGGSSESAYLLRLAQKLTRLGMRVIRHNHRGAGPHGERARKIYHSGSSRDILKGLQTVAQRWPDSPLFPIGFSLSGTMLLNLLSWHRQELMDLPQLKAAMSVCAPIDLERSSQAIDRWRNKHLDAFYVSSLLTQLLRRGLIEARSLPRTMPHFTLREFDEAITAPLAGFRDRLHYYESCSPKHGVANIRCPTLVLAAADDPVVPAQTVLRAPYSTKVLVSLQNSGGHLGFISRQRTPQGDRRWLDHCVISWIRISLIV